MALSDHVFPNCERGANEGPKGAIAMDQLIGLGLTLVMVLLGVGLGAVLSLALEH
jgi:hypothetical protein